ncbi:dTDP-4-dehydrorhamnose 3,5-epimerase [Flagellimonas zhangzhouensis]|uniref:dTDP-4-dehydrorhamnose 3,5-epimerase n=1 Tax=Flagellimonas zhangzhouensis TaxID=1073328 RepID=A0A1H2URW5_9FLAO|nr:dTDP-4-dehydrorhamnose 3,5-epimerase [Allomuricauda zhangzhouensis]SDQ14414.1 dTDP-4-dehydrorhamnose 3,5-epimerase [Allomuricauda zhangzhouensis]SDW58790.1 dTDP-4-dehydrorhamnose 3,5-epimerase [Allomuricauda zhangzhouensis]
MKVTETKLKGCFILEPRVFEDERGYFFESFNHKAFCKAIGQEVNFVQDNQSFSNKGVLRGLHFQKGKHAQAKLVRVLKGRVLDVAVDLRQDSETYGQHVSVELTSDNNKQLFIPRGFAHGFVVLSDTAKFIYKCDNYYCKMSEGGIRFDTPELKIDWKLEQKDLLLSEKDKILPTALQPLT